MNAHSFTKRLSCKKRKEKITPAFLCRREFEHVGLTLITVVRDAMYGFMPPVNPLDYINMDVYLHNFM